MNTIPTKGSARTEGWALAPAPWGRFGRCLSGIAKQCPAGRRLHAIAERPAVPGGEGCRVGDFAHRGAGIEDGGQIAHPTACSDFFG